MNVAGWPSISIVLDKPDKPDKSEYTESKHAPEDLVFPLIVGGSRQARLHSGSTVPRLYSSDCFQELKVFAPSGLSIFDSHRPAD
jgi:hypothetical protein